MACSMRDRFGIDVGQKLRLEEAVDWAGRHDVRHIDIQLDTEPDAFTNIDAARASAVRQRCQQQGVQVALHTASAVNVAECAPLVGEAVDGYLRGYIDAAALLDASWVVVHAGFHFTADVKPRMQAGLARLRRMVAYAETKAVLLLLENLNKEPDDAEVHYLAHTLEEWCFYYERIHSSSLRLSFTANHAHLIADGVAGFLAGMPVERVTEVRLADCFRNGIEQHLRPGDGDFDFPGLFRALAARGFTGRYTCAFGSLNDMLAAREQLATLAE